MSKKHKTADIAANTGAVEGAASGIAGASTLVAAGRQLQSSCRKL